MGIDRRCVAAAALLVTLWAAGAAGAQAPPAPPPADAPRVAEFRAPGAVVHGRPVILSGRVDPAGRRAVVIERLGRGAWHRVRTVATRPDGRFRMGMRIRRSANFRASAVAPDGSLVPGRRRFVGVRRRASFRVTAPRYQAIAGRVFRARGAVVPSSSGERVVIQGSRNGGRFRPLARPRLRKGRISAGIRVPAGGRWRFRVVAAPRPGRDVGARAAARPVRVLGVNPHRVPKSSPRYIVQARSQMRLFYYERGRLTRVFPVVFGKPSTPTPLGTYRVYSKTVGPGPAFGPLALWYHRGYGIHGTNRPDLLRRSWRYYSAGCTRNYNANIRWLWPRVPIGTPVRNIA